MKYPFMPLFQGDLLADTLDLSAQQFGAYMLLILHAWKHEAEVCVKDAQRIARVDNRHWTEVRTKLDHFFEPLGGLLGTTSVVRHPRVAKELAKAGEISSKRKGAAMQMHANRRANAGNFDANASHPHSHNKRSSLNRKNMQPRERQDSYPNFKDKGVNYRSPPAMKSDNVLQPLPEKHSH